MVASCVDGSSLLIWFERIPRRCYNQKRSVRTKSSPVPPKLHVCNPPVIGQVAQLVERSPEKAGVGGSIPSLATIKFSITKNLLSSGWVPSERCPAPEECEQEAPGMVSTRSCQ